MTDPTEELLATLRPSSAPAELMARLRAARPSRGLRVGGPEAGCGRPAPLFSWRRAAWLGGLGAAAAWILVSRSSPAPTGIPVPTRAAVAEVAANPPIPGNSQVFLPVESTRTLVSLQPARVVQVPDQAPQRFVRAIWVDDLTAVGADTDAALLLRRAHEMYVPVSSPVY